jgi:DNA repair protein RadC
MADYVLIRDLPAEERPRERLARYGPAALRSDELLAIIWRTGSAAESVLSMSTRVLSQMGGLSGVARASLAELMRQRGVGEAKAIELKAAIELGKRLLLTEPDERPAVRSPHDIANLLLVEMGMLEQEHLRTVILDTKNRVLAIPEIYKGSLNSAVVRVGELFREAIRQNAAAIVLVHNHPSGDPTPSKEDVEVTERVIDAGKLLDIEVLDHLVIGRAKYVSLKERRLAFR